MTHNTPFKIFTLLYLCSAAVLTTETRTSIIANSSSLRLGGEDKILGESSYSLLCYNQYF
jgi:hypothetical protein